MSQKNNHNNQQSICLPETDVPRIVVVGAGFAGMNFIKKLKNKPVQIVLVDQNNYHQFQPLLYQVAIAGLEPDAVNFPVRKLFKTYKNLIFRYAKVTQILPDENTLKTESGDIPYDYLVLATGTKINYYGLEDVRQNSIGLKDVYKALNIRNILIEKFEHTVLTCDKDERKALTNFVIAGAGPTGVELSGALAEFKNYILRRDYPELTPEIMKIYLLEMAPRVLPGMSEKASRKAHMDLTKLGVNVMVNTKVNSYDGHKVVTGNNHELIARTFIWAAGVEGTLPEGLPESVLVKGNRLRVDETNRVKISDNIFAVGDIAAMMSEELPKGHPMLAPVAIQQGRNLSKNIMNIINAKGKIKPFRYKDKGMLATIGKTRAVADIKKMKLGGFIAWIIWATVHLYYMVGVKNKMVTALSWFYHYLTYDKANRHILRGLDEKQQ